MGNSTIKQNQINNSITKTKKRNNSCQKAKLDIQFPKISRTAFCNDYSSLHTSSGLFLNKVSYKQNQIISIQRVINYVDKIKWVLQNINYQNYTQQNILQQHKKLKKQLVYMNENARQALSKIQNINSFENNRKQRRSLPNGVSKNLILKQKEVQINTNIIQRYKKQIQTLNKKVQRFENNDRDQIQEEIETAKNTINQTKNKIKQLKIKNKELQNMIINTDAVISQMKRLQLDLQMAQRKKLKAIKKKQANDQLLQTGQNKIASIQNQYQIAQNYFEGYCQQQILNQTHKKLERDMYHKKSILEMAKKKLQTINQSKQQKYHTQLKNLQDCVNKQKHDTDQIRDLEIQIANSKNLIRSLSQKVKILNITNQTNLKKRLATQSIQEKITQDTSVTNDSNKISEVFNNFMTEPQTEGKSIINKSQIDSMSIAKDIFVNQQNKSFNEQKQFEIKKKAQTLPVNISNIEQNPKQKNENKNKNSLLAHEKIQNINDQLQSLYTNEGNQDKFGYKSKKKSNKVSAFKQIKEQFYDENIRQSKQDQKENINQNQNKQKEDFNGKSIFHENRPGKALMKIKSNDNDLNKIKKELSQIQGKLVQKRKYKIETDLATVKQSIELASKTNFKRKSNDFEQLLKQQ